MKMITTKTRQRSPQLPATLANPLSSSGSVQITAGGSLSAASLASPGTTMNAIAKLTLGMWCKSPKARKVGWISRSRQVSSIPSTRSRAQGDELYVLGREADLKLVLSRTDTASYLARIGEV
jgi:hypothetical protein